MNFNLLQKILVPIVVVVMLAVGWQNYGWGGVALVVGGVVMWALIYLNRLIQVLKRAADRPVGYLDSAVMLNAKLKAGVSLMHVLAMTRSLGEPLSPKDEQPELFRWTDNTQSHVTCEFRNGRLVRWELYRPPVVDGPAANDPAA